MIRAHNFRHDECFRDTRHEPRACKNVIDAPADVPRAGVGEMAPPRVVPATFREMTKRVHEARFDNRINARALFFREPFSAIIFFRVREVMRRMRDVEIAAEDNRFLFVELSAVRKKRGVPPLLPERKSA